MGPGSYFGEASLLDPSNTRNCNIISIGDVSCMQLQRNDFATIFRGLKKDEEDRAKAMMKKKATPLLVGSKGGKAGKPARGGKAGKPAGGGKVGEADGVSAEQLAEAHECTRGLTKVK